MGTPGSESLTGPISSTGISGALLRGFADGFVVKYDTTTRVIITSGSFESDGIIYTLVGDTTHTLTSLASGDDFHYLLLNKATSTPSVPLFLDTTTEPVFDPVRRGWYVGDNRVVGVIFSPDASATILYFDAFGETGNFIKNSIGIVQVIAVGMNPDGTFQTPNVAESSVFVPVNGVEALIAVSNTDANSSVFISIANNEAVAVVGGAGNQFTTAAVGITVMQYWIALGASRNVKLSGSDSDENNLSAQVKGYGYTR